ncbi:MAG: AMP-binding protein, partial [Halobacteriaceae archaeon]
AGGAVSTIYQSSSKDQVEYLLSDAGAKGVVVSGQAELDKVLSSGYEDLEFIVSMDEMESNRDDVHTLADIYDRGMETYDREEYEEWIDQRDPDDLASLIYTSGTTGRPKGVRLSHYNFKANIDQSLTRFGPHESRPFNLGPESRAVSFLPLAHVFERMSGHFLMFCVGAEVAYAESPDTLREDFNLIQPTSGTSVPRVYEKIYEAIR